jgi:hypothetical protein
VRLRRSLPPATAGSRAAMKIVGPAFDQPSPGRHVVTRCRTDSARGAATGAGTRRKCAERIRHGGQKKAWGAAAQGAAVPRSDVGRGSGRSTPLAPASTRPSLDRESTADAGGRGRRPAPPRTEGRRPALQGRPARLVDQRRDGTPNSRSPNSSHPRPPSTIPQDPGRPATPPVLSPVA